jgi:NAD(P)-dependent dehydrogenase (short-subunit alcohol dehydrogenase family)
MASSNAAALVVGGTSGIGKAVAEALAARGQRVFITGRDAARAQAVAATIPGDVQGLALDLAEPEGIAAALAALGAVDKVVISAIERDQLTIQDYDPARALRMVTLKLVGYAEVIHALIGRLTKDASIVLLGGLAKERPYPGSTTVSTVNGGVQGMVHTLAVELGPIRVNAVHPGVIGDTDAWAGKPDAVLEALRSRTPTGRLCSTADVTGAVLFLLDNQGVNGVNLNVDGGWLLK